MGILACLRYHVSTELNAGVHLEIVRTQFLPRYQESLIHGNPVIIYSKLKAIHYLNVSTVLRSQKGTKDCSS